jgi:hypothetical protein
LAFAGDSTINKFFAIINSIFGAFPSRKVVLLNYNSNSEQPGIAKIYISTPYIIKYLQLLWGSI